MQQLVAIDFESAGTKRGLFEAPVQVATAAFFADGKPDLWESYIKPDRAVQARMVKLHGINDLQLQQAPPLSALWPQINHRLQQRVIIAHNVSCEQRFLAAFSANTLGPWLDSLTLMRRVYRGLDSYALQNCCELLGLDIHARFGLTAEKSWHDAQFDACASLALVEHVIAQLELGEHFDSYWPGLQLVLAGK